MKWVAGMFPNSSTHPWPSRANMKWWSIILQMANYIQECLQKAAVRYFLTPWSTERTKQLILCGLEGWLYFNYIQEINSYLQRHLELSIVTKKYMVSFFFFAFRLFWGEGHFLFNHAVIIYIQSVCSHITITMTKGNRCK